LPRDTVANSIELLPRNWIAAKSNAALRHW